MGRYGRSFGERFKDAYNGGVKSKFSDFGYKYRSRQNLSNRIHIATIGYMLDRINKGQGSWKRLFEYVSNNSGALPNISFISVSKKEVVIRARDVEGSYTCRHAY
jgi:hypothetical protein